MAQVAALKSEIEQAKRELAEVKGRISSYLEEISDLKVAANVQAECRHRAEESQCRAEKEQKDMVKKLAQAIEDQMFAVDLLLVE